MYQIGGGGGDDDEGSTGCWGTMDYIYEVVSWPFETLFWATCPDVEWSPDRFVFK